MSIETWNTEQSEDMPRKSIDIFWLSNIMVPYQKGSIEDRESLLMLTVNLYI